VQELRRGRQLDRKQGGQPSEALRHEANHVVVDLRDHAADQMLGAGTYSDLVRTREQIVEEHIVTLKACGDGSVASGAQVIDALVVTATGLVEVPAEWVVRGLRAVVTGIAIGGVRIGTRDEGDSQQYEHAGKQE